MPKRREVEVLSSKRVHVISRQKLLKILNATYEPVKAPGNDQWLLSMVSRTNLLPK